MIFLLELGPGMYHAIHGLSSSFERFIRYSAYFLAFVIAALAITYYGLLIDLQVNFSNGVGSFDRFGRGPARARTVNELIAATAIILWVASLVITALSVYTWMRRKASPLKTVSVASAPLLPLPGWLTFHPPRRPRLSTSSPVFSTWSARRGILPTLSTGSSNTTRCTVTCSS
jgi:hypothetical protein